MIILYWWYWDIKFHICKEQHMHSLKLMTKKKNPPTVESIKPLWILMYPKDSMIWDTTTGIL